MPESATRHQAEALYLDLGAFFIRRRDALFTLGGHTAATATGRQQMRIFAARADTGHGSEYRVAELDALGLTARIVALSLVSPEYKVTDMLHRQPGGAKVDYIQAVRNSLVGVRFERPTDELMREFLFRVIGVNP